MRPAVRSRTADARRAPVPAVRGGIVSRRGLFERLGGAARVTQISAPAGSGKTFLLRSWIAAARLAESTAWVSVPGQERDPQQCRHPGPERDPQQCRHPDPERFAAEFAAAGRAPPRWPAVHGVRPRIRRFPAPTVPASARIRPPGFRRSALYSRFRRGSRSPRYRGVWRAALRTRHIRARSGCLAGCRRSGSPRRPPRVEWSSISCRPSWSRWAERIEGVARDGWARRCHRGADVTADRWPRAGCDRGARCPRTGAGCERAGGRARRRRWRAGGLGADHCGAVRGGDEARQA